MVVVTFVAVVVHDAPPHGTTVTAYS
jgi:hypothetical protein